MEMEYWQAVNNRGKIALYRHGRKHMLTVRVACEDRLEAERFVVESGSGMVYRNEWKGKETWWVRWTSQVAARMLTRIKSKLEGSQLKRAQLGIDYTVLIHQQWKGHGVGQTITEQQWKEREMILEKMSTLG